MPGSMDIQSADLQPDNSINVVVIANPPFGESFTSAVLNYGDMATGSHPYHVPMTGPMGHLVATIPPQSLGRTIYITATGTFTPSVVESAEVNVPLPPAVPTDYVNPTGKECALASFKFWLTNNVPPASDLDFKYFLVADMEPPTQPSVEVVELQYFNPEPDAFGMIVFPASSYPANKPATQGMPSEMLIRIQISTAQGNTDGNGNQSDAQQKLYRLRDRFRRALRLVGTCDDITGIENVPPIPILDFNVDPPAPTGIIAVIPTDANAMQERYIEPESAAQNIHRYHLLVRMRWYEMN